MKPRIYVASGLQNAEFARHVMDKVEAAGGEITYDWTTHGSVKGQSEKRQREVATLEARGVQTADALLVVLPGGIGTHTEFGIALGTGIPIHIFASRHVDLKDQNFCHFYTLPTVKVHDDMDAAIAAECGGNSLSA